MKTRRKIIANSIPAVLIVIILLGISKKCFATETVKNADTKLLIVIDNSGSMKENLDFVENTVSLLKLLVYERGADADISYLLFNETTLMTDTLDDIQIVSKNETCIMQGVEAADQWMTKEIECGNYVKVLFISDLFSSRYLESESGVVKTYDINQAAAEQEEITAIEEKWAKWCNAKKASVLIWTWESFCNAEKAENTVSNLKENNKEEISAGYQVVFEPDKNIVISSSAIDADEETIEFIKQTVCSFEILMGSSNANWKKQNYMINPGETRQLKVDEDKKLIYLFFPQPDNIIITYNNIAIEAKYDGLYILDRKEYTYSVSGKGNRSEEGYLLNVPDLRWDTSLSTPLKKSTTFTAELIPSESLSGSWGAPDDYHCVLRIKVDDYEIYSQSMTYNAEKGSFFLEHAIAGTGWHTFIFEVNGKEIVSVKRKIN